MQPFVDRNSWCRLVASLALILGIFFSMAPAAAQSCPPGIGGVSVEFLPAGAADGSKERREHALISDTLASDLGIAGRIDPAEDINPQIRVTVDSPANPGPNAVATANFTVAGTFVDAARVIRVYEQEDSGDEDAGQWKLVGDYPSGSTPDDIDLSVTAHAFPASTSTTLDGGVTTTHVGLCEPAANSDDGDFTETTEIHSLDKQVVILAPHGGDVEEGTSEAADEILATLQGRSFDADLWKAEGTWDLSDPSERWHITSGALQEASWPALEDLFDEPDFDLDQPYRYALSLHGFGWSGPDRYGVILGGRSSDFEKCYMVRKTREALAAIPGPGGTTLDRSGEVAFYVFEVNGYDTSFPNNKGQRIEAERSIRSLRGLDGDNIVNRLSPNPDGRFHQGGIQLELSNDLRDDAQLLSAVATGAGEAMADILDGTADPFIATGCAYTVKPATPVEASIGLLSGGPINSTLRREEAKISSSLAQTLGISADDLDPAENGGIYPQIRLAVTAPLRTDGAYNEGVFTVTGQFTLSTHRVDVHPEAFSGDTDSGEHKLLADLSAGTVEASVYTLAASSSSVEFLEDDGDRDGRLSVLGYEVQNPGGLIGFSEGARLVEDREAIVLAPNTDLGPNFWPDVLLSQTVDITNRMELAGVYASRWAASGFWLGGDAFSAWHVADTFHDPSSFPALAEMLSDEHASTGEPFGRALTVAVFDGFDRDVIVGGLGDRTEKCYLVHQMQQALTAAGEGGRVAFYVVDAGGDVSVPDGGGDQIGSSTADDHAGDDPLEVGNRLGAESFRVTQSDTVHDDDTLRDAVSNGLGDALGVLVEIGVPAGFSCASL
ncbi:MAG: poly-gamma-glutamate hydrolase family protein [Acidobacteriota bacterium]|nr:poly-gamma-glutamate hydrolase family protein [Acidobacteriota bacterium]